MVISDKENRGSVRVDLILFDQCSENRKRHGVAVIVNRSPAPTAGSSTLRRISPVANRPVVRKEAVDYRPRDPDTADTAGFFSGSDFSPSLHP